MKNKFIYIIAVTVLFTACASTEAAPEQEVVPELPVQEVVEPEPDLPEWVRNPPLEEGMIFGIGSDTDSDVADQEAVSDSVWQLHSRLKSVVIDPSIAESEVKDRISTSLRVYIEDAAEWDGEIIEEYNAPDGIIWKLARMPIYNAVDAAEGVLKSHSEELGIDKEVMTSLIVKVEEEVPMKRVENPENQ